MDTNASQDRSQGGEIVTLDIQAILAGSFLSRMIDEGHVSKDVLSGPVQVAGLAEALKSARKAA